jgi:hypothetical protein
MGGQTSDCASHELHPSTTERANTPSLLTCPYRPLPHSHLTHYATEMETSHGSKTVKHPSRSKIQCTTTPIPHSSPPKTHNSHASVVIHTYRHALPRPKSGSCSKVIQTSPCPQTMANSRYQNNPLAPPPKACWLHLHGLPVAILTKTCIRCLTSPRLHAPPKLAHGPCPIVTCPCASPATDSPHPHTCPHLPKIPLGRGTLTRLATGVSSAISPVLSPLALRARQWQGVAACRLELG